MTVLSWGANSFGQLGLGYRCDGVDTPQMVSLDNLLKAGEEDLKNIKSAHGGGGHSLLLTEEGSVFVCGCNNYGQLGNSVDGVATQFTRLNILDDYCITSLASTWDSCYAITEDGLCIGWGSNVFGQLGKPADTVVNTEKPIILAEDAIKVSCGVRHAIVLCSNGKLLSSGEHKYGQLGREVTNNEQDCREVPGLKNVESISCGFNHTLALLENGQVYSWGINKWGQLGIEPSNCKWLEKPAQVLGLKDYNFSEIHCGWSSSHLLTEEGALINFGRNNYGQLGTGNSENTWMPSVVKDISFEKMSVGSEHCLGLSKCGTLFTWGWNEHGSCGVGNTENLFLPTKLPVRDHISIKYFEAATGQNFLITY